MKVCTLPPVSALMSPCCFTRTCYIHFIAYGSPHMFSLVELHCTLITNIYRMDIEVLGCLLLRVLTRMEIILETPFLITQPIIKQVVIQLMVSS